MEDNAKSLWDVGLEALAEAGLSLDTTPTEAGPVGDRDQTHTPVELEDIKSRDFSSYKQWLSEQKVSIERRRTLEMTAWSCSYCSTFNGLDTKGRVLKTCRKCKKARVGEVSYLEQLAKEVI